MYNKLLPYGYPEFFEGEYKEDKAYPLYIQQILVTSFRLKKNKIPTIQIKNSLSFSENEYIENYNTNKKLEPLILVLTNIDLKLFLEQYDVEGLEYLSGWKFKGVDFLFKKYIDKWIKVKIEATKEKNAGKRQMAKLQLNSLYGKLATTLEATSKEPFLKDNEVHYSLGEKEAKKGVYLPRSEFLLLPMLEK